MTLQTLSITLADEAATLALGSRLAHGLKTQVVPPITIFLHGDLGAGKTTFTRGVLRGLGFEGRVKSPTYALLELYVISGLNLYHFDFYRLTDPDEWHEAGFRDLMTHEAVSLIEWPSKAAGAGLTLPRPDLELTLTPIVSSTTAPTTDNQRRLLIQANTPAGLTLMIALQETAAAAPP
jgi:tRNA threonylcarbamoyladenosine biosynthesis protein TsaE